VHVRDHQLPTALLLALAIACLAAGCQPSTETPGDDDSADEEQNWSWGSGGMAGYWIITPEGDDPSFLVYAPQSYVPWVGWPVLVFLHDGNHAGMIVNGDSWSEDYRGNWAALAEAEGFLLVVPGVSWQGLAHSWASEGTDGELVRTITIVQQNYNVDLDHVQLFGHGSGGYAAERLGFTGSIKLSSVGVHGAGLMADWADYPEDPPTRKIPFLVSHDPQDQVADYEAGLNLRLTLEANGHEVVFRDEFNASAVPDPLHHQITPQIAAIHWDHGKAHPWQP
jgi:poly(3-hydroxybutyrate) depolymerase